MDSDAYDLVVLGSGPSSIKCAVDSAKRGKRVAVVDEASMMGGVCVHTGTIPSKTFREAVLHLTGHRHQGFYGRSYKVKHISLDDIRFRVSHVLAKQTDTVNHLLGKHNITLVDGVGWFEGDPNRVVVGSRDGVAETELQADKILLATGSFPARRKDIEFDGTHILDADQILSGGLQRVPRHLIVLGAGVIGMEYASMFNIIPGARVTVIDGRDDYLTFADKEVVDTLTASMRERSARFLLGETVTSAERVGDQVLVQLQSGKQLVGDALLYCLGRQAATEFLNLESIGLETTSRGLITVNDDYQTTLPHIYACGDVIGFPALASTSMAQGKIASGHMWGAQDALPRPDLFPYGIYTVPEVSMVGKTERQLTDESTPYEVGMAHYSELAKGQMLGQTSGFLKLVFCPQTLKLLGVHCIGEGATEIVHIGQVVISLGETITYFRDAVFNYPTLAELFRDAAFNGLKRVNFGRQNYASGSSAGVSAASVVGPSVVAAVENIVSAATEAEVEAEGEAEDEAAGE